MSSDNIDPAAVATPVRTTIIDNTSIVDIHSHLSEWNTYLVRFTPTNSGPVVSAYIHHLSLSWMIIFNNLSIAIDRLARSV